MSEHTQVLLITQSDTLSGKEDTYGEYLRHTFPIMAKYGAKVVAVGAGLDLGRATNHYGNNAVLSFPSQAALESFINDPDYLAIHPLQKQSVGNLHTAYFIPRPPRANPEAVARAAFDHFKHGLATGKWQGFLEMLSDNFTFHFPRGKYKGSHQGKEKAAEFFAYVSDVFVGGLQITEVKHAAVDGNTVLFEFEDVGQLRGAPYAGKVIVSFDVEGDKLAAYREYFGSE